MTEQKSPQSNGLQPQYHSYQHQKCFIGHSVEAPWRDDLVNACTEVLPQFDLDPWYAADHFEPTKPLRDKVVQLIANARYGIYDLSYWQDRRTNEWQPPRNVFIELGMAIALNRPTLLLRHTSNEALPLPKGLEGLDLIRFSGDSTLKKVLNDCLPHWVEVPPDQNWLDRFCIFGNRRCEFRSAEPCTRQWGKSSLSCHIADGFDAAHSAFQPAEQDELRSTFEHVFSRYSDLTCAYLDDLPLTDGYQFLLCSHCQTVRSTPFAVYRLSSQTSAEVFIAIGMSIGLETLFKYDIPKIILVRQEQELPSLLRGYEFVEAVSSSAVKRKLNSFIPAVLEKVRETVWKPRPLPFVENLSSPKTEKPIVEPIPKDSSKNILVVDDLADWRKTISVLLSDEGYQVYTASNRFEAMQIVSQGHIDLVTTDVRHDTQDESNRDGLKLMHEINEFDPRIPIIVMTGYANVSIVQEALAPGPSGKAPAFAFLEKNKLAYELLETVRLALEKNLRIHEAKPDESKPHLIRVQGEPEVYLISDGIKHHIPDGPTLEAIATWDDITFVTSEILQSYEEGIPIPSLASGETETLEFKRNLPRDPTQLARIIAAFANTAGGTILFGVEDDGWVVGLENFENQKSAFISTVNQANENVTPVVNWTMEEIRLDTHRSLVMIMVPSSETPHTINRSGAYAARLAYEFEQQVAEIFRNAGAKVDEESYAIDRGIDLYIEWTARGGQTQRLAVVLKSITRPVDAEAVSSFYASTQSLRENGLVDELVFVSRTGFTETAQTEGRNLGINLFNLDMLVSTLKRRTRFREDKSPYATENGAKDTVKILIVDDDPDILILETAILTKEGYSVIQETASGSEALHLLSNEFYDLMILDINIRDPNGFDVIHQTQKLHPKLPIIAIAGYSDVKIATAVMKAESVVDYIMKPFAPEDLISSVNRALQRGTGH